MLPCPGAKLEWTHIWPVAIRAFGKNLLVKDHRISVKQGRLLVTLVTRNVGVPALEQEMSASIVIEG